MRGLAFLAVAAVASPAPAATLVAVRTLPAGTVIEAADLSVAGTDLPGVAAVEPAAVIGRQTRTAIYEGRPVQPANLTSPTLVGRNALVTVNWTSGGLSISTEGRALGAGGAGDTIRVLNIASRATISARINPDGTLSVVSRQ